MRSSRPKGWDLATLGRVTLVMAIAMVALLVRPGLSADEEIIRGDVIIEATALRPQVLMTEPEHRVTFVNRSGRMVHLDFILHDPELHHVFQVPDQIWAIFHRAGRHPYEVHFSDRALPDLHGAIEVVGDPYGGPDPRVCGGITVQGACIER
jgi:hypothetical protein